jgi:predicted Zn-dependent protease with MMP-like domain
MRCRTAEPRPGRFSNGWSDVDAETFSGLVADALDSMPEEFLAHMQNVDVLVEDWPSREHLAEVDMGPSEYRNLLGLYHGVPLTHRNSYYAALPDTITIFQKPIELQCGDDEDEIRRQVRKTVIHEIAHHYGIDDDRLDELGY